MSSTYLDRLAARSRATGTVLCLGLDPDPDADPREVREGRRRYRAVRGARPRSCPAARRRGQAEPRLLRGLRIGRDGGARAASGASIPSDVPVIADAKRGDIGSTAARQAVALFDVLGADAVTVSPYLGEEAIRPLLERERSFRLRAVPDVQSRSRRAPGSARRCRPDDRPLQRARCTSASRAWRPVGDRAARSVSSSGRPRPRSSRRSVGSPRGCRSSCPGVGAQGGAIEPVLATVPRPPGRLGESPGGGLLVNVSRGIAAAASGSGRRGPRRATRGGRR